MLAVLLLQLDESLPLNAETGTAIAAVLSPVAVERGLRFVLMLTTKHTGALLVEHESHDIISTEIAVMCQAVEELGRVHIRRDDLDPETASVDCWADLTLKRGLVLAMAQARRQGILLGGFSTPKVFTNEEWAAMPSLIHNAMDQLEGHTPPPSHLPDPSLN